MTRARLIMKTKPYSHQEECYSESRGERAYAILLEQGLGKSWIVLATMAYLYNHNAIDRCLIVAPNGVHSNWIDHEIPKHLGVDQGGDGFTVLEWKSTSVKTKRFQKEWEAFIKFPGLKILVINIEAYSNMKAQNIPFQWCSVFLKSSKAGAMMVVDESSRIKTPSAMRTKRILALGRIAKYKRILTGTPVTQSPFDLYSQFLFLDPTILGFTSYYAFRNTFGVFEKKVATAGNGRPYTYDTLLNYIRLDVLSDLIRPHSFRRTKEECLDLPSKIYQRIPVEMTPAQSRMYDAIMDEGEIIIPDEGFEVLAPLVITRLLRCQQILGGFLPFTKTDDIESHEAIICQPIPGKNPKLDCLLDLVDNDYQGKTIIWARFRQEINAIVDALQDRFGRESVVQLHGGIPQAVRRENIVRYQDDDGPRFLVGQQQSGIGVTLTRAKYVFYYSNTFSYEQRYQSEDRAHRIGLDHAVVYIDLEIRGTIDERIREVLKTSRDGADKVLQDTKRKEKSIGKA